MLIHKTHHFRLNMLNPSRFVLLFLAVACALGAASCSRTQKIPADPKLVSAFVQANMTLETARMGQAPDPAYGAQASNALEQLVNELGLQVSKYRNPRQAAKLKTLTMELAEIHAHAGNIKFNSTGAEMTALYNEWAAFRPRLRKYLGPVVDAPPNAGQ